MANTFSKSFSGHDSAGIADNPKRAAGQLRPGEPSVKKRVQIGHPDTIHALE